ncbi:response regulator transcription factor [Bifidobacterium aesculapii]|uniref:response regulator transcription factor n=1 Tax=Bifidobacterium aesculapii TaxID=1329411 RepID=UPI0006E45EA2|nr:response regulator transcription factor [Bifidobacterium aesculapii]
MQEGTPRAGADGCAEDITIAVADNDAITLRALTALLERVDGFRVLWTAQSAREVIVNCLTDERWPEVLLLDAELGDDRGTRVCRRLRETDGDAGILIITAYPLEAYRRESALAGAQGLVGKADYAWLSKAIRLVHDGHTFAIPLMSPTAGDLHGWDGGRGRGEAGGRGTRSEVRRPGSDDGISREWPVPYDDVSREWPTFETAAAAHHRILANMGSVSGRNAKAAKGTDALSRQESQVLELASLGFTQSEIAARLGISAASVRTHSSRARTKLDARTLVQAVVKWLSASR